MLSSGAVLHHLPALFLVALSAGGPSLRLAAAPATMQTAPAAATPVPLPNRDGALKFAVLGDFGTGGREQYQLAAQMTKLHAQFPFELVILVGDNMYGSERASDFQRKFEIPYAPLLKAGVKFYASLGNHDGRNQGFYKLFNMDGRLYYSFKAPKQSVRFFALETTYPEPEQMAWVEKELKDAGDDWKIDARSGLTAKGFDTDLTFLAAEVYEDQPTFNAIARNGQVVDSGVILRGRPEP